MNKLIKQFLSLLHINKPKPPKPPRPKDHLDQILPDLESGAARFRGAGISDTSIFLTFDREPPLSTIAMTFDGTKWSAKVLNPMASKSIDVLKLPAKVQTIVDPLMVAHMELKRIGAANPS